MITINKQQGSAHVVIIIILVIAVLGLLGYIFWQNFFNKKETPNTAITTSETKTTEQAVVAPKTYVNDTFSFEYPADGWQEIDTTYTQMVTSELRTNDYTQKGMGVTTGAIISINVNNIGMTRDEQYAQIQKDGESFGAEDLKKVTINGNEAFTYNSAYEGIRYHTYIVKDGMGYDIVYQFADNDSASKYMDVYNQVTASFKLK